MIKKLYLLLSLMLVAQMPLPAHSYQKSCAQESLEILAQVSAGVVCVTGMIYLIATYPKFFGELAGALLKGLTDQHYCYHCTCFHYGHHYHPYVKITTTTYY